MGKRSGKRKVRIEEKDKVKEERGVGRGRYLSGREKREASRLFFTKGNFVREGHNKGKIRKSVC